MIWRLITAVRASRFWMLALHSVQRGMLSEALQALDRLDGLLQKKLLTTSEMEVSSLVMRVSVLSGLDRGKDAVDAAKRALSAIDRWQTVNVADKRYLKEYLWVCCAPLADIASPDDIRLLRSEVGEVDLNAVSRHFIMNFGLFEHPQWAKLGWTNHSGASSANSSTR